LPILKLLALTVNPVFGVIVNTLVAPETEAPAAIVVVDAVIVQFAIF
jgi:hypothetical protein